MGESLPLQELIDFDELQDIQDGFAKIIRASSVIFSPEGDALTRFSNPTGFCSLIQSTKEGMRCCFQSFTDMGRKALESDEPVIMRCFAHGVHFAAPIIIDSERKATMFMGQFITEEFSPDQLKELREIAAQIDVDPDRLVAEAKKMRVVTEDVVRNYTTSLSQTVRAIAMLGAQAVELMRAKDALQESHDELESRVKERTAELASANTGLKREIAEREIAEDRIDRLNSVLKAIRNVNQLIVSEKDRDNLLQKACDILLEARGYDAAWFGLLREDTTFERVMGSDSRRDPPRFCDDMVDRSPSPCFKDALTQKERIAIVDKSKDCGDCPFGSAYAGNATVLIRVEHAGKLFGLLAIALAADVDVDVDATADEKELLKEVASDIAFALHDIELDEARKAIENALQESEEKYRTLIENVQDGVFLIQDGELKFVNEAFARIPGYTVEEIRGMNFGGLVAPEDMDMVADRYTRMMAGEDVPREYEFHGIRKGEDTQTTVRMTVGLTECQGKPAVIGTVKDVTERKAIEDALRESEIMYRTLYDSSRDAIMMLTPEEGFIGGNSAILEMFGCKDETEFTSMTPADSSPEYQPDGSLSLSESQKAMAIAMEKGSHYFEWKHRRVDGVEFFADVLLTRVKLDHKNFLQATVRDITERKIAEAALHESEAKYRRLTETIEDAIISFGMDTRVTYLNQAAIELGGYSEAEALQMKITDILPEDQISEFYERFSKRAAGENGLFIYEVDFISKAGERIPVEVNSSMIVKDNEQSGILLVCRDMTERKIVDQALRESEEKYRTLIENIQDGVFLIQDGELKFVNEAFARIPGYTVEEMLGMNFGGLVAPEDMDMVADRYTRMMAGEDAPMEYEFHGIRKGEDTRTTVRMTVGPTEYQGKPAVIGTVKDVTERKAIEDALFESEEKYRVMFETAKDAIFLSDETGKFVDVNQAACESLGYSKEELLKLTDREIDAESTGYKAFQKVRNGVEKAIFRVNQQKKDGALLPVEISGGLLNIGAKRIFLAIARDITERKKAEEKLKESEEKYRELVESANSIILRLSADGRILFFNKFAQRFFGYTEDEILGRNAVGTIVPETDTMGRDLRAMIMDIGQNPERYTTHENENVRRNGERVWVSWTNRVVRDSEGRVTEMLCIGNDITERKQLEERMCRVNDELEERVEERTVELKRANEQLNATIAQGYHAQKMESLGILAGGIAHDFNNFLTITLGNISIAKTVADPNGKLFGMLSDAEKASLRAKDLTLQLLAFSRSGEPIKRTIRIAKLIEDSTIFAQRGSNVQCEFEIPDHLMSVDADEGQISQVASNIIINACQAMPDGGTIRVKCENMKIEAVGAVAGEAGESIPLAGGDYVRILIKDEGTGIPEEQINRIFDPFFTTKEEGTGLGLATAHSIIEKHGGYLTVESTVGLGSTFYVYLPAAKEGVLAEAAPETSAGDGHGADDTGVSASGRILVLDDEEDIRELLGMILVRFGYVVEFSVDGAETIAMYRGAMGSDHAFDVVIVDLTIPGGIGGGDVIRELTQIDPTVKAIVSSGYANDPMMSDYRKYGFSGVISKPYEVRDLIKTVREVIGVAEGSHEPD